MPNEKMVDALRGHSKAKLAWFKAMDKWNKGPGNTPPPRPPASILPRKQP